MERKITPKNVNILCRICLTSSKTLVHLSTPIKEKVQNSQIDLSIHKMLELVTCSKVVLNDKKFPSKICQMCLSFLKIAYELQLQFKNSQDYLEKCTNSKSVEEFENLEETLIQEDSIIKDKAAVELIYGENKFDLKDVLVVVEEEKENTEFEGFIQNLGSVISVGFSNNEKIRENPIEYNVELINLNVQMEETQQEIQEPEITNDDELDISKLRVKKYPSESKIVIEKVNDTNITIFRTLYECQICKEIFPNAEKLEKHVHEKHRRICEICGHVAHTRSQLHHHLLKHKRKEFTCNYCDKKFETTSRLKEHLRGHKNEQAFLCNFCGKRFNFPMSLTYHLRLHSEKTLTCNICGLKFRMPNTLKRHLRTHTREKPYPCDYCLKKFCSRGEKVAHEMTHTGKKQYYCEYCGKGFIKSSNRKVHYLTHQGPHECSFCSKTFIDARFLKLHVNQVHKDYEIM